MREGELTGDNRNSLTAPLIFFTVATLQIASRWLEDLKKRGAATNNEIHLRGEIKQLLKEAASLSQPSTFAQSAKLRRLAAAKEKELVKQQELHSKEIKLSYDLYLKVIVMSKIMMYVILILWFWRTPVASVSRELVQPFGSILSWRSGGASDGKIMVGIIPWLILSTRVSRFICRLLR